MSRFYGSLSGSAKTQATRCGTRASGVTSHVRGWDTGIRTSAESNAGGLDPPLDVLEAHLTGGSTSAPHGGLGFTVHEKANGHRDFHINIHCYSITGTFDKQGNLIFLRGCPDFTPTSQESEKPK